MTKDKITDKYIKAVQKQFKHYHTTDARFISDLKDAVISYAAQQDSLDYEQLVSQFGDPQELVNDYFSEQSIDNLYHHYRFRFDILSHIYLQHKCTTQKGIRYFYTKRSNYIKGGPSMIKSGKFISALLLSSALICATIPSQSL